MSLERLHSAPGTAQPVGPYSQATVANGFVFTSGQIPASVNGGQPPTFAEQVRQTLRNLEAILAAAGTDLGHVVKVNGYLTDPGQLETYNDVYAEFFQGARPARTTVCVSLWGVALEIECVAVLPSGIEAPATTEILEGDPTS